MSPVRSYPPDPTLPFLQPSIPVHHPCPTSDIRCDPDDLSRHVSRHGETPLQVGCTQYVHPVSLCGKFSLKLTEPVTEFVLVSIGFIFLVDPLVVLWQRSVDCAYPPGVRSVLGTGPQQASALLPRRSVHYGYHGEQADCFVI